MIINKETFNLIKEKLVILIINFFPGILILELFFSRGFFHDNINNIHNLISYLIWGFIISFMFNALFAISLKSFIKDEAKKYFKKKNKKIPDELSKRLASNYEEEETEKFDAMINTLFCCIIIFIAFILKFIINYMVNLVDYSRINDYIRNDFFINFVDLVLMLIIRNPVEYIFLKITLHKDVNDLLDNI